jgi:AraC-like DNA-binding protein
MSVNVVSRGGPAFLAASGIRRRIFYSTDLGCIEDFHAPGDCPAPCGHSDEYQLVFPYAGAFERHVGVNMVFVDATRVLFVNAGEDYSDSHVADGGHDSIIVTPRLSMLQELCGCSMPSRHPAFQRVAKPTVPRMSMRIHRLLHLRPSGHHALANTELLIALLREALAPAEGVACVSPARVVRRAKQFLHAHLCEHISLNVIAEAVEVSGAYLTDAFTRSEGMPLCRYRKRLRLNRALAELPHCEDITRLALNLGFSSHAHFSSAFKLQFGVSPSAFRADMKQAQACSSLRAVAPRSES